MRAENGNALFLILIAVALFGALSYALTTSGRGGGTIAKESGMIAAAQMTQAGAQLRTTSMRMQLTGTPIALLDLNNDDYTATNPCTVGSNCIFAPDGGGAILPELAPDSVDTAHLVFLIEVDDISGVQFAVKGIGSAATEAVYMVWGIKDELCLAINKGLNITGIPVSSNTPNLIDFAGADARATACVKMNLSSGGVVKNTYYQVLAEN